MVVWGEGMAIWDGELTGDYVAGQREWPAGAIPGDVSAAEGEQGAQVRDRVIAGGQHHRWLAMAWPLVRVRLVQGRAQLGHSQDPP